VEPTIALEQIEKDKKPAEGRGGDAGTSTETGTSGGTSGAGTGDTSGGTTSTIPTRFHATKELTTNRVVRDIGQIYEEIISHFATNGLPIRVSIDVESDRLDRLSETRKLDRIEALEATRPVHLPTAGEESHSRERCCA
jgi:hypothetical protein